MLYLSLRQYEYVCAIGRYGSLSAAALHLNVSQPALSTALTRVEEHLGHPLFTRRRGAALAITPQGRTFLHEAEKLLRAAAGLEGANYRGQEVQHLRLGCFADLAPFHLAPALRALRAAFPDNQIAYSVGGFENVISALIDGQMDLAITYALGLDAGFTRHTLFDSHPNALVSPDHSLARRSRISLEELEQYPLILSAEGLSAQHVLTLFRRNGLQPIVAHRAASLEIQRSLAAHGEGVAISYAAPPGHVSYDRKPLISLPITTPNVSEAVVLVRHGTGPADPLILQAEALLIENLRKS